MKNSAIKEMITKQFNLDKKGFAGTVKVVYCNYVMGRYDYLVTWWEGETECNASGCIGQVTAERTTYTEHGYVREEY